ncbi:MAG TPA: acyltransferase [Bacteroidia bacterium]|nr:acyltransferase [Bacteroidia bacterium]
MGTIRTLLAVAVALYHSFGILAYDQVMTGGMVSVQTFYIISGFYMALILHDKYKPGPGSYRLFITNRFLRIFPVYWAFLVIVVLSCLIGQLFFDQPFYFWYWTSQWAGLDWSTIAVFIFANIFLFGSDWLLFSGVNRGTGKLELTADPFMYRPMAFQFLLIPQIWSVGIELVFYLLAPLLLRAKWHFQLAVLLLSLGLRFFLYYRIDLHYDPWTYRFFPNELAFFMAGSLAFKFYNWMKEKYLPPQFLFFIFVSVLACICFYPQFDFVTDLQKPWIFYGFFLCALPFLFRFSGNNRIDRIIGELSFPVYICHHLVMFIWRQYFWKHTAHMEWFGIVTALSSLAVAFLLYKMVMEPVEKIRQRRWKRQSPDASPA